MGGLVSIQAVVLLRMDGVTCIIMRILDTQIDFRPSEEVD